MSKKKPVKTPTQTITEVEIINTVISNFSFKEINFLFFIRI